MKNTFKLSLFCAFLSTFVACEIDEDDGDTRDVFEGQWNVSETSKLLGNRNYLVDIESSTSHGSRINLFDFYKLGFSDSVYATVSAILSETATIPSQILHGHEINGSGTLVNDNLINFTYYVDDGNDIDTVEAAYTR